MALSAVPSNSAALHIGMILTGSLGEQFGTLIKLFSINDVIANLGFLLVLHAELSSISI
jgi:hypothetical protein